MMLNLAALRHRPDSEDCFLYKSNELRLRLHTAADDAKKVQVHFTDPYWRAKNDNGDFEIDYKTKTLERIGTGEVSDYYGTSLTAPFNRLIYIFEITDQNGDAWLLGDRGVRRADAETRLEDWNYFRVPYFHEIDRVKTPNWVKRTVWYQIFPERFANGDVSNDPSGTKAWNPSDHPGREDFYGGDLQGVLDHLDDLQELGINGLYFCPIFFAHSNHKYDTIDYFEIDPNFGDKTLFARLVNEAHRRGMRIMLDAVFNHMGQFSMQWQDVLDNGSNSKFVDWFHINHFPLIPFQDPIETGEKPPYETFAFDSSMPKLNTANPQVQEYLLEVASYWIREFDIDAWRLDVANEVDHHFWKRFYRETHELKDNFYVLGEVWHSSQPWLNGNEFDGVMNYSFMYQIQELFLRNNINASTFLSRLTDQLMLYRDQTNQVMLNMLDSHDTPRLLTVAGDDIDRAIQALAFTFTQTGTPCIYYGTEMGMNGKNDPDDRKPMDWTQFGGDVWQRVHMLVTFRRDNSLVLGTGTTSFNLDANGLIVVTRVLGNQQIQAWFNTTSGDVRLEKKNPILSQGYARNSLAPKGFIITAN